MTTKILTYDANRIKMAYYHELSRICKAVASWKLGKEAHDRGDPWTHLEVEKSKVKVIRHVVILMARNSTKNSCKNTKISRKVFRAMTDIPHQFQGQKVKGQGHQA